MADRTDRPEAGLRSAAALLQRLFDQPNLAHRRREFRIWQIWETVVGPQVAQQARPARLREGVLEVRVAHPVWMQQLQLLKPKILTELNRQLGAEPVTDLFFKRGTPQRAVQPAPAPPATPWRDVQLPADAEKQLTKLTAQLQDPELAEGLRALLRRQAQLDRMNAPQQDDPAD